LFLRSYTSGIVRLHIPKRPYDHIFCPSQFSLQASDIRLSPHTPISFYQTSICSLHAFKRVTEIFFLVYIHGSFSPSM